MMNEEEYIKNRMPGKNPFSVPEGYFDSLTEKVMSRLPERQERLEKKTAFVKRLRPLLYAAACIGVAIFSVTVYFHHNEAKNDQATAIIQQQEANYSDSYIDEATDYAMLDNEEIYYSLLADM